ncbi:MAG: hypothetical protein DLM72_07625 [Candidatus Nitrosopolaris wilkensis]|nr:MAG: hypothetical protein DLM72_07625 [Candidatus Nitrosopolaris wilkensis]
MSILYDYPDIKWLYMVLRSNKYQRIYEVDANNERYKMIDNNSKDDVNTTTRSTEVFNLYDTARENYIRIVDELTKAQPQYTQSISNLQLDYIAAVKNTIQNVVTAQKLLATNGNVPIVTPPYTEEFVKQSNEITKNVIRAVDINNQLTISALHAAGENYRTFNRTIDSVTEFTSTAAKAWNSFLTAQQQQFLHKQ